MKLLKKLGIAVLALVVVLVTGVFAVWHNEIQSVMTIEKIADADESHSDGAVYTMKMKGGYYFDEFLEQGGASNDSDLISFVTGKITKGLIQLSLKTTSIGCSSFTCENEDGDRLFARNYDMSRTNTMILYTDPGKGRHASVSTVDLKFISINVDKGITGMMDKMLCLAAPYAPMDGMNDAGVAMAIYVTNQGGEETVATDQCTDKPDITSSTMVRMVLDYADDVDEAVELIRQYDLHDSAHCSYHYMIADASGKSAVCEWVYGTDATDNDGTKRELVVTYNEQPYQVCTNFNIGKDDYYASDDEKTGFDRYNYLTDVMKEKNAHVSSDQEAMDILSDVGRRTYSGENHLTIHSVVYNLEDLTGIWVGNEHYGEEDYTFDLALN